MLAFLSNRFSTKPKSQDKNVSISRTKRALKMKYEAFFIIFKGLSVLRNCLRPESGPLMLKYQGEKHYFLTVKQGKNNESL